MFKTVLFTFFCHDHKYNDADSWETQAPEVPSGQNKGHILLQVLLQDCCKLLNTKINH
jgi:hypothetical protein